MPVSRIIAALLLTLTFAAIPANVAKAGYLYVADYDSTPTTGALVNLPINAQTVSIEPDHSLFEMALMYTPSGGIGDTIEIGVTTDPALNGDSNPHWFVFSWINGTPRAYDSGSDFVSDIGNFWSTPLTSAEGTSERVGFSYSTNDWWLTLNGVTAGYFPGSEWGGVFTKSSTIEVYGEVYQTGSDTPTLNGTVSGYDSFAGGQLSTLVVDPPYAQSDASSTGFTAFGPVPEPSTWAMLAAGVGTLLVFGRRRGW